MDFVEQNCAFIRTGDVSCVCVRAKTVKTIITDKSMGNRIQIQIERKMKEMENVESFQINFVRSCVFVTVLAKI